MADLMNFLRWLIPYAISGGFWHFIATWLFVGTLIKILWFIRVNVRVRTGKKSKKDQTK